MSIDEKLPFNQKSNLSDPHLASKIFYFSYGLPRYTMDLIKQASRFALKERNEYITEANFRDAYNKITRSTRPYAINPFELDKFELTDEIKDELKRSGHNKR